MRSLLVAFCMIFLLGSCANSTQHGECIGIFTDKDPKIEYEVSTRNAIWTVIFSETLIVPIVWSLEHTYCPVGLKKEKNNG